MFAVVAQTTGAFTATEVVTPSILFVCVLGIYDLLIIKGVITAPVERGSSTHKKLNASKSPGQGFISFCLTEGMKNP